VAACGSAAAPAAAAPSPEATIATSPSAAATPTPQPDVLLAGSRYGAILFDGSGRTLYLFSADGGTTSQCYNACATAWPPFVIAHAPTVGRGLVQGTVSTTARTGGAEQVVYAGHPLYYYAGDHAPGEIKCQAVVEFGGGWYVVDGNGNKVTRP
jgi:predicted lipoprotein with Yx(FWY)xxD motif